MPRALGEEQRQDQNVVDVGDSEQPGRLPDDAQVRAGVSSKCGCGGPVTVSRACAAPVPGTGTMRRVQRLLSPGASRLVSSAIASGEGFPPDSCSPGPGTTTLTPSPSCSPSRRTRKATSAVRVAIPWWMWRTRGNCVPCWRSRHRASNSATRPGDEPVPRISSTRTGHGPEPSRSGPIRRKCVRAGRDGSGQFWNASGTDSTPRDRCRCSAQVSVSPAMASATFPGGSGTRPWECASRGASVGGQPDETHAKPPRRLPEPLDTHLYGRHIELRNLSHVA